MKALLCGIALLALLSACKFPGDTTNAPTAGKTYWVAEASLGVCKIVETKGGEVYVGLTIVAGPFATRDNAMRAMNISEACK